MFHNWFTVLNKSASFLSFLLRGGQRGHVKLCFYQRESSSGSGSVTWNFFAKYRQPSSSLFEVWGDIRVSWLDERNREPLWDVFYTLVCAGVMRAHRWYTISHSKQAAVWTLAISHTGTSDWDFSTSLKPYTHAHAHIQTRTHTYTDTKSAEAIARERPQYASQVSNVLHTQIHLEVPACKLNLCQILYLRSCLCYVSLSDI